MPKEKIVVICPGRGSYSRDTSGYLGKNLFNPIKNFIHQIETNRKQEKLLGLLELDSMPFKSSIHMKGENASALIFACSLNDYLSIDQNKYEIVGITGNSMGWYSALALGESLSNQHAYELINTMGSMMKDKIIGGQLIYPFINDEWQTNKKTKKNIMHEIKKANAYVSIFLGGYFVIGGDQKSLDILKKRLPPIDNYPFQIPYHGAFHTPLLVSISEESYSKIQSSNFKQPTIPLIDGRGKIWSEYSTHPKDLYHYTLGTQVTTSYDFTRSITVALKEFCPDRLVVLGPGNTLGGVVGQILIENSWNNIDSKQVFQLAQQKNPFLISMSLSDQREIVSK